MKRPHKHWLIMPVLNERENLEWLLPQLVENYNVICVDNGSTDGSLETARNLAHVSLQEPERGYGSAVLKGLTFLEEHESANDPIVVIYDADGSSPFENIADVIRPIFEDTTDFVIAQRIMKEPKSMPLHAKFGNWLQTTLIRLFTGVQFTDMGPLRAMRLSSYFAMEMRDPTWAWNIEMQVKAAFLGMRIKEIRITYLPRKFGKSKISGSLVGSLKAGTRILWGVLYYYFDARRVRQKEKTIAIS